ncbi:MAG TPA: hypothetical protein VEW74_00350, partial [Candidatus Nitrosotalea sp.]|nr:hypothetical protein [Candidatus Nitrosotalea sp.]
WELLLPAVARAVRPNVLLVSAGFDYVAGDIVGDLGVGVEAAHSVASTIRRVAEEHCGGSVAYILEGGYGIEAIAQSIALIAAVHDAPAVAAGHTDPNAIPRSVRERVTDFLRFSQGIT